MDSIVNLIRKEKYRDQMKSESKSDLPDPICIFFFFFKKKK